MVGVSFAPNSDHSHCCLAPRVYAFAVGSSPFNARGVEMPAGWACRLKDGEFGVIAMLICLHDCLSASLYSCLTCMPSGHTEPQGLWNVLMKPTSTRSIAPAA